MLPPPDLFAVRYPDGSVSGKGIFEVHPAQHSFITSGRRNKLFMGGRGCGKTWALVLFALYLSLLNPGFDGIIAGRTQKEAGTRLKRYWDKACRIFCDATGLKLSAGFNKSLQRERLANSSVVWFKGYDRDPDSLRGDETAWYALDELEFGHSEPRYVWNTVNLAVRAPGAKVLQVAGATTPNGLGGIAGHFYQQQQIALHPADHDTDEVEMAMTHHVSHARLMDNPWLEPAVKRQLLASVSGRMYRQEVLGLILSPEDVVFSEFSVARHVIDWRWKPKLPYIIVLDPGTSHAYFAAVQIVDREGYGLPVGSWVVAEERKLERTSYHAVRKELSQFVKSKGRKPRLGCSDKAVKSEATWFRQHFGVDCLTCKGDDEQLIRHGVELLRFMLDPYDQAPRLYFSRQGLNMDAVTEEGRGIVGAMTNYQYMKDRAGNVLNQPLKDNINDHPIDALRYGGIKTRLHGEFHGGQPLPFVFPEELRFDEAA